MASKNIDRQHIYNLLPSQILLSVFSVAYW